MSKITELTWSLAEPIALEQGCTIWDIEYVKEAGSYYLRVFIDHADGISIDHCEAVSRALSDLLDEADPIQDAYNLEISSAGADRILKRAEHFEAFIGSMVDLRLYKVISGAKLHTGELLTYDKGDVTLLCGEETLSFIGQDIAQIRLHISF